MWTGKLLKLLSFVFNALSGVYQHPFSGHHFGKHRPTLFPCKGGRVGVCGLAGQQLNLEAIIGSSQ